MHFKLAKRLTKKTKVFVEISLLSLVKYTMRSFSDLIQILIYLLFFPNALQTSLKTLAICAQICNKICNQGLHLKHFKLVLQLDTELQNNMFVCYGNYKKKWKMTLPDESRDVCNWEKSRNLELVGASTTEWQLITPRGGPRGPPPHSIVLMLTFVSIFID